jgi:hypothetical protein
MQIPGFTMSADAFIACLVVAAALLAGWILVRFERTGPRSLTVAALIWAAAAGLIFAIPALVEGVFAAGLPEAPVLVVFGLALPIFTYFFLAGGWFMRTLMRFLDGAY